MMKTPITITKNAASQLQKLLSKAPDGTQGIRLNIKPTGCSGNSYVMDYVKPDADLSQDEPFEAHGATLYIPKIHSWMLFGMVIDYASDDLGNAKFDFINPNEAGRCGCGESFHVSVDELQRRKGQSEKESA